MPQIVRRPEAENDLIEIFVNIGQFNMRAAKRFLQAAERAFELLAAFPSMVVFVNPIIPP